MDSAKQRATDAPGQWEDCPAGELQNLSLRLRTAERRRQQLALGRTVGVTTAASAALVLAIGLVFGGGHGAKGLGGLSCSDCQANFAAYHGHLADGIAMQEVTPRQMGDHLMKCNWCFEMYEDKYPGELQTAGVVQATSATAVKPVGMLGFAAAY